jgi:hypothetical protein
MAGRAPDARPGAARYGSRQVSLRLFCPEPSAPPPRRVMLELRCDGDHGLFPPEPGRFERDGFVAQYGAAMQAGWLDRQEAVLCPDCSGKAARKGR